MDINYTARASEFLIEYYADEIEIKEDGMDELWSAWMTKKFVQILVEKVKWIRLNLLKLDKLGIKHESVLYKYRMREWIKLKYIQGRTSNGLL